MEVIRNHTKIGVRWQPGKDPAFQRRTNFSNFFLAFEAESSSKKMFFSCLSLNITCWSDCILAAEHTRNTEDTVEAWEGLPKGEFRVFGKIVFRSEEGWLLSCILYCTIKEIVVFSS